MTITAADQEQRTYSVRTLGCQMNVHDSERMAGLLEEAGYLPATEQDSADLIVINERTLTTGFTGTWDI